MTDNPIGISLLGCGVVGSGVVRMLNEQRELLERRTGLRFDLRHVVVRDPAAHASKHPGLPYSSDASAAIDDPKVSIVIETVGGTTAAAAYIERSLRLGKPVVTANKSLLAARGPELFALARKHDACIGFEASCGGGIPIIDAISRGLVGNRVDALVGILNGTCNVILTRMTRNRWTYEHALAEAQKLALLAGLAFNVRVAESDIHVEGIEQLQPADIAFADELGYVIKLLAIAHRAAGDRLGLRVHPTLVHKADVLAEVSGGFNAISVYGHALGHTLFYGRGAGQMPTASAVVADLVSVAMGTTPLMFKRLRIYPDVVPPAAIVPMAETRARYYLRLSCRDEPGVMGQVSQILGQHGISLSAILQRETEDGQFVPVVITTHEANEGAMRDSLAAIDKLPTVVPPTVCLRIIDQPKEFAAG
jgi:homoserine dehydrogenase